MGLARVLVAAFSAVLVGCILWDHWSDRQEYEKDVFGYPFEYKPGEFRFPQCVYPRVWRNALSYGQAEACKQDGTQCIPFIKQRMLSLWANNWLEGFDFSLFFSLSQIND